MRLYPRRVLVFHASSTRAVSASPMHFGELPEIVIFRFCITVATVKGAQGTHPVTTGDKCARSQARRDIFKKCTLAHVARLKSRHFGPEFWCDMPATGAQTPVTPYVTHPKMCAAQRPL